MPTGEQLTMPRAPSRGVFEAPGGGRLRFRPRLPKRCREALCPGAVEVHEPDGLRAEGGEAERDRPADPARAHLADRARPGGAERRAPRRDEAGVVGIEPARAVRREHDRVDRPHRPDQRLVDPDPCRRPLLVGVGDVDPVVVPGRAMIEELVESGALLGGDQQVVGDLDAAHSARERVQPRGLRGGDVVADESDANLLHEPSLPQTRGDTR